MSTPARELLTIWIQAVNDGDVALLTGLYDSSARLLPTFSPHFLSKPEQIHNYFEQLASREDLSVQLHEGSVVDQQLSESVSGASGLYSFSFRVDGVLLSFASRFSFLVDTTKPAPIIHHHSSQVPRTLN